MISYEYLWIVYGAYTFELTKVGLFVHHIGAAQRLLPRWGPSLESESVSLELWDPTFLPAERHHSAGSLEVWLQH